MFGNHRPKADIVTSPHRTLVRRRMVGVEEFFTPSIILLGAAAVSVYAKDGQLDLGNTLSRAIASTDTKETVPEPVIDKVEEEPAPAPAPAPVKAAKKKKETPAPSPAPAPAPAVKSTTELVKEVASKIEDQRATEELVASRKAAKDSETSSEGSTKSSEPDDDFEEVLEGADKPKSGRKRKFVLKVIKKVIAPWRKWEAIQ
jgi:outer membrane biosynthesis protein TonB